MVGCCAVSLSSLYGENRVPSADKISALRGMRDVFSAEYAIQRQVQNELEQHLRRHAYMPIDLPILENTELYLRKSGEDIASRLYEFNFKSRRIALRPEITASLLRAYVEGLQDEPLPLRLQYTGPVFRYEKPQQNRYRQFTMTGAEMLGAGGLMADAEMLHLACAGLEKLGIRGCKLVIGHTEALKGFLRELGLRQQLSIFLLRNMENIRKRGLPFVVESLRGVYPQLEFTAADLQRPDETNPIASRQLVHALREMSDADAHQAIADLLRSLNIHMDANRDESEVIDRLLYKIREDPQGPKLRQALDYMQRLSKLAGSPADVLPSARKLLDEYDQPPHALAAIETLLKNLAWFGGLNAEIQLDFGLNRGLHYYTGLMFEIHCSAENGEDIQLGGGGRYDNLVTLLGGSAPVPALGFAYGIERIAGLLNTDGSAARHRPDVYVIPIEDADYPYSFEVARALRARDFAVEICIDRRSVKRSLKYADRRQMPLVILIGETERQRRRITLRDMRNHQERTVAFDDIQSIVEGLLADHAQRPAQR